MLSSEKKIGNGNDRASGKTIKDHKTAMAFSGATTGLYLSKGLTNRF
jgi:hypothetical protein